MTSIAENSIDAELLFETSYQRVEPGLWALPAQRVKQVNLDVPLAITIVLGAIPRLARYREGIIREFHSFEVAWFDGLEQYAMALSHANALYLTAGKPPIVPSGAYEQGFKLRDTLHVDTKTLVRRGLLNAALVKGCRGSMGYEKVAAELQILCQVLKENWPIIEGKCATSLAELEHATKVAVHLLRIAKHREQIPELVAQAADRRNRCFTLFVDAYTEVRSAIQYLRRHEDDADDIAPRLYRGVSSSKKHVNAPEASSVLASPAPASIVAATEPELTVEGPFMK